MLVELKRNFSTYKGRFRKRDNPVNIPDELVEEVGLPRDAKILGGGAPVAAPEAPEPSFRDMDAGRIAAKQVEDIQNAAHEQAEADRQALASQNYQAALAREEHEDTKKQLAELQGQFAQLMAKLDGPAPAPEEEAQPDEPEDEDEQPEPEPEPVAVASPRRRKGGKAGK